MLKISSGKSNNFKEVLLSNHHHQGSKVVNKTILIPKGYLPIKVGKGEEQKKIMVPVMYLNHPLFSQLLKEAEEEYGFDQQGTMIIPCRVEEFWYVLELIDREKYPQQHHHVTSCFSA